MNLVGHLREKGQVLPSKTLGTFPLLAVLVEGGELDLARSVVTVVEDGGFDASNPNLMDGFVVFGRWIMIRVSGVRVPASNLLSPIDGRSRIDASTGRLPTRGSLLARNSRPDCGAIFHQSIQYNDGCGAFSAAGTRVRGEGVDR